MTKSDLFKAFEDKTLMKKLLVLLLVLAVCAYLGFGTKKSAEGSPLTPIVQEPLPTPDLTEMRALASDLDGTQVEMINITMENNVVQEIGAM